MMLFKSCFCTTAAQEDSSAALSFVCTFHLYLHYISVHCSFNEELLLLPKKTGCVWISWSDRWERERQDEQRGADRTMTISITIIHIHRWRETETERLMAMMVMYVLWFVVSVSSTSESFDTLGLSILHKKEKSRDKKEEVQKSNTKAVKVFNILILFITTSLKMIKSQV